MASQQHESPHKLNLLDAATAATLLEAALRYHALGFTVLPILKGQKKSGLAGWQDLRPTEADLRRFDRTGKYGGVAIRPGALSQNLVMIDCDGERVYEAFCSQFPALVDTYTERSGSGKGYHLFYQVGELPSPGTSKVNRKGIFDTDDLGFEAFYDTGAVVVAPSVHPSGNHYTVYKPLDVLRLGDLNQVITWALSLETKQERESKARKPPTRAPTRIHTGTAAPHNGEIAPDLLSDIEQALGVQGYKRDGWSKPIRCVLAHHEHDDSNPAASWNKEKHIYSCLKCGVTDMLAHPLAEVLGLVVSSYYEAPERKPRLVYTRTRSPIAPTPAPEPAPAPIKPRTLWQHAPFMVCDLGEYILIERQALALGIQDGFIADQIAAALDISQDTVKRWIDKCLSWKVISECPSAELKGIGNNPTIPFKNADGRDLHGRFASNRYRLTPQNAQEMIARRLPDYVQELMDRGEADVIRRDEATEAGLDDASAAALETTTRAIAQTVEAFEDSAHNERESLQKARELLRMDEYDLTPFTPDTDAASVAELRAQLIGALIATAPNAVWQHSRLMWIAGVKKSSVSALIKKSAYVPAPAPTFIDVQIGGDDPHRAVRSVCAKHHGAPVAWLDSQGEVLSNFSHDVPTGAAAVRLNLGKKYLLRSAAPAVEPAPEQPTQEIEAVEPAPPDPVEVVKVRARRGMLPRLRGCLRARGWRYVGGPSSYWERGNQTSDNTCEAMIAALLLDYEWAKKQRAQRQAVEANAFAEMVGAEVRVLA